MTSTQFSRGVVFITGVLVLGTPFPAQADIYRWDTGALIPGTEGIAPGPGVQFSNRDLRYADFSGGLDLTGALFNAALLWSASWLDYADFSGANLSWANFDGYEDFEGDDPPIFVDEPGARLTNANLTGANLTGASFWKSRLTNASLAGANLTGAYLGNAVATGANLTGADLTGASLGYSTLTDADLTGAVVTGAGFVSTTSRGFRKEQLYSTASYQAKDLRGIILYVDVLSGWDFHRQDLTEARLSVTNTNLAEAILVAAYLQESTLTNTNLVGADLRNANLSRTTDLQSATFDADTLYNQWTVFPDGFDPIAAGLTLVPSPSGDFDANDVLDVDDIDALAFMICQGYAQPLWLPDALFDLNEDNNVDGQDHRIWVSDLKDTRFGDADLNGEFDSSDMVRVFAGGKYEASWIDRWGRIHNGASWSEGDWNGDGVFDSSDMVLAFVDGGYEKGPQPPAVAVPEPTSAILLLGSLIFIATGRRRFDP